MSYVIWKWSVVPHAAAVKKLQGFEAVNTFFHGVALGKKFPRDAAFHMNPDFPTDLTLTDNVRNIHSCMLVSSRLAQALQARNIAKLEYLPVAIVDHKGKVASKDYFVLNPLELVDCIDRKQSIYKESKVKPGEISFCDKLVLDEARIPGDRKLFRLKGYAQMAILASEVAGALSPDDFIGLRWLPVGGNPMK
jgi:hypothetical protein